MEAGNDKEVKVITEKYKLQYAKGSANRLDGVSTGANLTAENMKERFSGDLKKPNIHLFDDGISITLIKATPATSEVDAKEQAKVTADNAGLKNALSKKMMDTILKKLEEDTKVKIYSNMIQE